MYILHNYSYKPRKKYKGFLMPRPASRTYIYLYQIAKVGRGVTNGTDAISYVHTCV
jgi:hypothetical protein